MNKQPFTTFLEILKDHENSERTALICGEETLTYRELISDAKHIAKALAEEGLKKGDRVLFCMRRTADAIRGVLGIVYAGGVFIAADPDWPEERLQFIAKDADACFSLTQGTFRHLMEKPVSDQTPLPHLSGDDEIGIIFTSGSTGEPKGAVLHHRLYGAEIMGPSGFGSRNLGWERFQLIMKFSYEPSLEDAFKVLAMHKTLLLSSEEELSSIDALGRSMEKNQVDAISGTSSMYLRFFETPSFFHAFKNIKYVRFVGEKVTLPVIEKIRQVTDAEFYNCYGCTEMMNCGTYHYRNDGKLYLGEPGVGVQRFVLDENLKEVDPGQAGELFIGGDPARLGYYLNRPELNAEKYMDHPVYGRLFRMGDLVRLEENGELTALGRSDGMVKIRGQRLETAEVEKRVERFPGVGRAAVKLIGTSPREALACWYTVSEEISETELRRFLSNQLPYYMVPTVYTLLDQMPVNEHEKLQYRDLPEPELPKEDYCAPETKEEKLLCEIFGQVLQSEAPVGVNDNFFALGGDSISAMEAASRLQKEGYSFKVQWLFTAQTARQLEPFLVPLNQEASEEASYAYALSGAQKKALERIMDPEDAECVYPVTREMKGQLLNRNAWMQYLMCEVSADLFTKEQFVARMIELTESHAALRSVFLITEGEEPLQVVKKEHEPDCFYVDLKGLSKGEGFSPAQKAYFRSLLQIDSERPRNLEREVLFRVGLIRISENDSVLFFSYSHHLLDGLGITCILRELIGKTQLQNDLGLWNRRMQRILHNDSTASADYWRELLKGCTHLTRLKEMKKDSGSVMPEFTFAIGGKKLYEEIVQYGKKHQITAATLLHSAFGRTLMELTGAEDVCFYSIMNGRTEEESELAAMTIVRIPVRIRKEESPADLQAQLVSSAAFADQWIISDPKEPIFSEEGHANLNIQNFFAEFGSVCRRLNLLELFEDPRQSQTFLQDFFLPGDEKEWNMSVSFDEQLRCWDSYNGNVYDSGLMKRIPGEMIRQIKSVLSEVL